MKFRQPDRAFPLAFVLLIFLVGLTAFAPPGLCPCWLIAEVDKWHPHPDGHPERPHGHGYLFELFQAEPVAVAANSLIPAYGFLLFLAFGSLWRVMSQYTTAWHDWNAPPQTPPPRFTSPA